MVKLNPLYVLIILIFTSVSILHSQDSIIWTPVGPGGGGAMYVPSISPHNPDLIYVSSDMSGVYRTSNAGQKWHMLNFRQINSSINLAPVFSPIDTNTIWDEDGNELKSSTDGGLTWSNVWAIPGSPNAMISLSGNQLVLLIAGQTFGLYISTGGNNFAKINGLDNIIFLAENGNDIISASQNQLWISTDDANNFNQLNLPSQFNSNNPITDIAIGNDYIYILQDTLLWQTQISNINWQIISHSSDFNRGNFRFVRADGNYVWLTTTGGKYQESAILSTDNGLNFKPVFFCSSSWNDTSNFVGDWNTLDFNCGWGGPAVGFAIAKGHPEEAVWTDYGRTMATFDAGKSWQPLYTEFADQGQRRRGARWQSVGLEVTSSWDIFLSPWEYNFINAAYTDIGGEYSTDGGFSWRNTYDDGVPPNWFNTTYNIVPDTTTEEIWGAFSGLHDIPGGWSSNSWNRSGHGGICYSTNGGIHWFPMQNGGLPDKPVTSIAIDYSSPETSRRLYAAVWSDGVWRSTDGGAKWIRTTNGLDCGDGTSTTDGPNTHISEVQVYPGGTVFALKTKYIRTASKIKNDGGLWRSTDHGDTWENISFNVADCTPNNSIDTKNEHSWADPVSFYIDENNVNHIYVCAQNCNNGKVQGGLYETTDGGTNWKRILQIYCAFRLTESKNYPNRFYLATYGNGIMISDDACKTWVEDSTFPFMDVTRITEDFNDTNVIWVNTFGGGIWKGKIQRINQNSVTDNNDYTFDIFPNPANEFIKIRTNLKLDENLNITITNLFGEEISFIKDYQVTSTEVKINTGELPSGLYFCKIKNGNYFQTRKFMIIK